jgi:chaperonin GroES
MKNGDSGRMVKKLKAFNGKILIQPFENALTTATGILIPDSAKKKSTKGTVIDVSRNFISDFTGWLKINKDIKEGDIIYYDKYSGQEILYDEKRFIILDRKDILALEKNCLDDTEEEIENEKVEISNER